MQRVQQELTQRAPLKINWFTNKTKKKHGYYS